LILISTVPAESDAIEQLEASADQFGLGADARLAPDVHVPLVVLALAAARHPLVAPALRQTPPAERQPQRTRPRLHHPCERRRELGSQREVPVVQLEVVELVDDLLARLPDEELGGLDHRRVDALERECARDGAKMVEEPLANAHLGGIEVPRTANTLDAALAHVRRNNRFAAPGPGSVAAGFVL
jgi:hypothetical protein